MKFHNPYQFIPVTGKVNGKPTRITAYTDIAEGETAHVRHDRWAEHSYSGRVLCQLSCLSPLVVGGNQTTGTQNKAGVVEPYTNAGGLAIPANSLRGMIANVAETISQSALRVLVDKKKARYSVRKSVKAALPAIGKVQQNSEGKWSVLPLALVGTNQSVQKKWLSVFGRNTKPDTYRASYIDADVLRDLKDEQIQTYQEMDNPALFYASGDNGYVGTLCPDDRGDGVLFINGGNGAAKQMPNKKNELFLPFDNISLQRKSLFLSAALVEDFDQMLRECYQATYKQNEDKKQVPLPPYLPTGYQRDLTSDKPILKSGDLLYFDIDAHNQVCELSFSAIWRKRLSGDLHDALCNSAGEHVLPWNSERQGLTPAECMFGVVEHFDKQPENKPSKIARNLASRIRFFDAAAENGLSEDSLQETDVPLKILASPKPPSPALYFSSTVGRYVSKQTLTLNKHAANGRKRYLPQPEAVDGTVQPWLTTQKNENLKQKLTCQLIPEKSVFYFHIDFENLAANELQLLLSAITPQTVDSAKTDQPFQHQLGLGKPFGLGQVKLERVATFLLNRKKRYSENQLFKPRYHQWWGKAADQWESKLREIFPLEMAYVQHHEAQKPALANELIDEETLQLLLTLGDAQQVIEPVCYPFSARQGAYNETEGFQWFANNDRNQKPQFLKKIITHSPLPTLES